MRHRYFIELATPLKQQYPLRDGYRISTTPQGALEKHLIDYHIKFIRKVYDKRSANVRIKCQNGKCNYYHIDIVAKDKKPKKNVISIHSKNNRGNKEKHRTTKKEIKLMQIHNIIKQNWASTNGQKTNDIDDNDVILYHGSRDGIIGDIVPGKSRDFCDFGIGFYTGSLKEQAGLLVKDNGKAKLIYTLSMDVNNPELSIYTFEDNAQESCILWALYIAYHRGKIRDIDEYPKLRELCDDIDTHDIIKGLIADDEMSTAFNEFLAEALTIDGLIHCLSKVKLGHQFVFKTQKACSCLHYVNIEILSEDEKNRLSSFRNKMENDKENIIEEAKELYPDGKRFRGLLKEYK